MALWPFRRRPSRRRAKSGTDAEGVYPESRTHVAEDSPIRRRRSNRKRRSEPPAAPSANANPSVARRNSFSPGRSEAIDVARPHDHDLERPHYIGVDPWMRPNACRSNERVATEAMWTGAPTLHGKGSGQKPSRRKSSKRRRTDHDREAEIRAMTNPAPMQPAETWNFSRPTRTSSKRVKTGAQPAKTWDPSTSDRVSLPTPESIRSGMSSDSEHGAFRLTALASLAPRPTLHYVSSGRSTPPMGAQVPSRTASQKRKLTERPSFVDDASLENERIDDLANEFDASDIRELMERDNRRRERKKLKDQARAERRLLRMAEERKAAQLKAAQEGSPPPPNLERGAAGRELAASDAEITSAYMTSSELRHANAAQPQLEETLGVPVPETASQSQTADPPGESHGANGMPLGVITRQDAPEDPIEETYAPMSPTSPVYNRFLKSKKSASKSSFDAGQSRSTLSSPPAKYEDVRASNQSDTSRKARLSFTSLLRWGSKRNRGSGPSSFSNTSREEMQAVAENQASATSPVPPNAATDSGVSIAASRKVSSGVPKRTRSRFREDLPELPMSPPDSQRGSIDATPPIPEHPDTQTTTREPIPIPSRNNTPTRRPLDEMMRRTPVSDEYGPSPEPHSISLASIDSEGSWLSGRVGGRSLGSRQTLREQANSRAPSTTGTEEELGITEDEYLSRLTPARPMRTKPSQRHAPTDAIPSSDEEDNDVRLGAVQARRQPGMVHASSRPPAHSMMSYEGLLTSCDEERRSESEDWIEPEVMPNVHRATSVNLATNNVKRISAGSAKVLDIPPRDSTDQKRLSAGM